MSASQPPATPGKPREYTAHWWSIHAWGIGVIASYFMYEQFYLIKNIHTTIFQVSPMIVFTILAMPRLIDGVLDPILGHWSDNMRSRWGRRRPFLLFAALLGAATASSIFWMSPQWPQWLKGVCLAVTAISLFIATGTYDMAHIALGYELSEAYADRSRVQAIKAVYHSLAAIAGGFVIALATGPMQVGDSLFESIQWCASGLGSLWGWIAGSGPSTSTGVWDWWQSFRPGIFFHNSPTGFRVISSLISGLIFLTVFFPLIWTKERYTKIVRKQHVNLWHALKTTLKCRPFVVILIINFTRTTGALSRDLFFYIGVYYVCSGDMTEYSKVMGGMGAVVAFLMALLIWPLTKPITRLIGKRTAFIAGAGLSVLSAAGMPLVARPGWIWVWFSYNFAFSPVGHILGAAASGIMPDICDIDELQHGERREGLFTAVQSFINKMEISVMSLLTGVFLTWTGFNAQYGANQPEAVLHRMLWLGFVPLIAIAVIAFAMSWFMPITAEMMTKVRAELDARHAAAGLAVAAPAVAPATSAGTPKG